MKNIYIYCEGQTEESFVNEILYPYFINIGLFVTPIICTTKRVGTKKYKGGVGDYNTVKKELKMLCRGHKNELVTTMFDYYGMPENTPGINCTTPDIYERINSIEELINSDINEPNCIFNFMVHEFEGILFSKPDSFGMIVDDNVVDRIRNIRDAFPSPEHINNSPETAPSKRIKGLIPDYGKVRQGTIVAKDMGIDIMMEQCRHFREWIGCIISRAERT